MLRGRHRGLPVAIDRAVMLPEPKLDNEMALQRRASVNPNPTSTDWAPGDGDGIPLRPHASSVREGL